MSDDEIAVWSDPAERTAVREFFFREAGTEEPAAVVRWWEKRRVPYNAAVGATGLVSIGVSNLLALIGPGSGPFFPPLLAIGAYAVLANVLYTAGWVTELALRPVFGRRTPVVGAAMFRYGFSFAIGVTLIPVLISAVSLVLRVVSDVIN